MTLNEKISIEEVIDETIDYDEWAKYVASLCKNCGAEPSEEHVCLIVDLTSSRENK